MEDEHQYDYYEALGVDKNATPDDIKRAFFKLVRKYPPEKDPEGYKKIRQAYDTLSDAQARREYDAVWQFGTEITNLMNRADGAIESGNLAGAVKFLKRVLVLNPYASGASIPLAHCLMMLGQYGEAVDTLKRVVETSPDVPSYRIMLANALLQQYKEQYLVHEKAGTLIEARGHLNAAIGLDKQNAESYISMARSYMFENKYTEAVGWAEKAIGADETADIRDFEALSFICEVHISAGRPEKILDVANRIEPLLSGDPDQKYFVAGRFAQAGLQLADLKAYEAAYYFLTAAVKFDPFNTELGKVQRDVELMYFADRHWSILESDPDIIKPVVRLAALTLLSFSGQEVSGGFENAHRSVAAELSRWPRNQVINSVNALRQRHQEIYNLAPELWDELLTGKSLPGRVGPQSGYHQQAQNNSAFGCGCAAAIVLAIIFSFASPGGGTFAGALIGWWLGRWIGSYFRS